MPENTIFALVGLIASAVICYGIPQGYYTSNGNPQRGNFFYDEDFSTGIVSPWYGIPVNEKSLMRRDYRDLRSIQPLEWQNAQYQHYISEAPQSSDFYPYPLETCRAARESQRIEPSLPVIQAPISGTEVAQQSSPTSTRNLATTEAKDYELTKKPRSSPSRRSTPNVHGTYRTQYPQNTVSPRQTTSYVTYPGQYYYPPSTMQNYRPFQMKPREVSFGSEDDEENDYEATPGYSTPRFYLLYAPDTSSEMNNKNFDALSIKNTKNLVNDQGLDYAIKKTISASSSKRKQQNTLDDELEVKAPNLYKFNKVHEKRQHLQSELTSPSIIPASEMNDNPYNLPFEMNVKNALEKAIVMQYPQSYSDDEYNEYYDESGEEEQDENDSWGLNQREQQDQMDESEDTILEDEEKFQEKRFIGEDELEEKKPGIPVDKNIKNEELDRSKKETKHQEAKEMKKVEKTQGNHEKSGQIMRLAKIRSQIEKSDTIMPILTKPSITTESIKKK